MELKKQVWGNCDCHEKDTLAMVFIDTLSREGENEMVCT